ncbi:CopM family metallochaperone [Humitalea sp. 24SJ18S-53]|uniref:CopM family metallochaperone n=1 Tax=Humitalea sp. 24SJ18S-53 TaxID=3422307 RepID=UPI003D6746D6
MRHLILAALLFATPALAQHAGHGATPAQEPASTREFRDANNRMHAAMAIPFTGNADRDFLAGMIAHHQGAIDMARVELRHGTDAQTRALAQAIITAQEAEILQMRAMLARLSR